jgi:transcriptional regulator with XRE-family HTH domain
VTHRDTSSSLSHAHDTPLQRFGATLRQCRQQRGLSQRALAARTGLHHTYVSEIELGQRNITVLTLLRLAYALDIPASSLLVRLGTHASLAPLTPYAPLSSRGTRQATPDVAPSPQSGDPATLLLRLGATLRQYRQQLGLSQPALAAGTGLNPTYIGQIEQGQRNVSVLSLLRIADALGISLPSLLIPLETR